MLQRQMATVWSTCNLTEMEDKDMVAREKEQAPTLLDVRSDAFQENASIPQRYTADGENIAPPIAIADLPEDTASLAVIVDDPDAPGGTFVHWVEFNIPPIRHIPEGARGIGVEGVNSWDAAGYRGPAPPSGTHRYVFKVYACDQQLPLPKGADKEDVMEAMDGHVLAWGEVVGTYSRAAGASR
jgi:Raf kinase inhibitor-like YbhB/YbcL family protein